ncbi:hypothetical protein RvY_16720-3 [Ramazzottius varieornatus]|uniref:Uncharacterized protein n=1 Tax=Ramazzottius varieornatus TaxID=947166 RepID=A0A1D1W069_RAMVA|nr:hypothetical protein RvY_16720-3 [Ramazzottius varieornatus]
MASLQSRIRELEVSPEGDHITVEFRQNAPPTVVVVTPSTVLPREPRPAAGAPSLTIPSFSATVGKAVDPFTGMTHEQLQLAKQTWDKAKAAAANVTGVSTTNGYVPFLVQVVAT